MSRSAGVRADAVRTQARAYVVEHELQLGSYGENMTSMWLHRNGIPFDRHLAAGKRRINFAVQPARIALELAMPYVHRDRAYEQVAHDAYLGRKGWVVLRLTPGAEQQLVGVCRVLLAALTAGGASG